MLLALSDAAWTAIGALGAALLGTAGLVIVAHINNERRAQDEETVQSVTDFAQAYHERGELIEGYQTDLVAIRRRVEGLERREQACLEALELAEHRIAVLEERTRHVQPRRSD